MLNFDINLFNKFNLISPTNTKKSTAIYKERDNTLIYSLGLVLFGLMTYLLILFAEIFVIENEINKNRESLTYINKDLERLSVVKNIYSELLSKSELLLPIVNLSSEKEIFKLLSIGEQLVNSLPQIDIKGYRKESNNNLSIDFDIKDIRDLENVFNKSRNLEDIENIYLTAISLNQISKVYTGSIIINVNLKDDRQQNI